MKTATCEGGVIHPASEPFSCTYLAPTCTSFTYSEWSACQPSGTQTRTVTSSSPAGCQGGTPSTTQQCTYLLPCTESNWIATFTPSTCPLSGQQTKTWTKTATCEGGVIHPSSETVACTPLAPSASCSDSIRNQDETGVDCGGVCAAQGKNCANIVGCAQNSDCVSGSCVNNVCVLSIQPYLQKLSYPFAAQSDLADWAIEVLQVAGVPSGSIEYSSTEGNPGGCVKMKGCSTTADDARMRLSVGTLPANAKNIVYHTKGYGQVNVYIKRKTDTTWTQLT